METATGTFIGRGAELESIDDALSDGHRLVTILGPPGVGKTRLARRYLERHATRIHDAALFCDLGSARTVDDLLRALGRTLEVPLAPGDSGEVGVALGRAMAARGPLLVILDNFEQLAHAAADTLGAWLETCFETSFLVTSRVRLRLQPELVMVVEPLGLPADDGPDEVATSDAVLLFVDRARHSGCRVDLARDGDAVARLVRRLDGLPLAIELVAERAGLLGVRALESRLATGFQVLHSRLRGTGARYTTLEAALDESWRLLDATEQFALAACSVFRGGFTLEAAASVVGPQVGDETSAGVVDVLLSLHERSLLRSYLPDDQASERRFGLLESVREFAAARLGGQIEAVRARHAAYFANLAARLAGVQGASRQAALEQMALETDNLLAVHERAVSTSPPDGEAVSWALTVVRAWFELVQMRGPLGHWTRLADRALEVARTVPHDPALTAAVLVARGWARKIGGRATEALADLEHALTIETADLETRALAHAGAAEAAGLREDLDTAWRHVAEAEALSGGTSARLDTRIHRTRAFLFMREGAPEEAIAELQRALAATRAAGDRFGEGIVLGGLGNRYSELGELPTGLRYLRTAILTLAEVGERRAAAHFQIGMGRAEHEAGQIDESRDHLQESARCLDAMGDSYGTAIALKYLADLELDQHDDDQALQTYQAAIDDLGQDRPLLAEALSGMGVAAARLGMWPVASTYLAEGRQICEQTEYPGTQVVVRLLDADMDVARAVDLDRRGNPDEARRRLARAAAVLDPEDEKDAHLFREGLRIYDGSRIARHTLEVSLERATNRRDPMSRVRTLEVGEGCRWFRLDGGARVELGRRRALRRVLATLLEQHDQASGAGLANADLFRMAWPGESALADAAANRVKVAISQLRSAGLRSVILTAEDGYLMRPGLVVEHEGPGPRGGVTDD